MVIKLKQYRDLTIGSVAVAGALIISKRYSDARLTEYFPYIGIITGTSGMLAKAATESYKVLINKTNNTEADIKENSKENLFSQGIKSIFYGVGLPLGTSALNWLTSNLKFEWANSISETINNNRFVSILHAGSDSLVLSGTVLCISASIIHLTKLRREF